MVVERGISIQGVKASSPEDKRLAQVCQDFEAVFLSMLWKEMEKSAKTDMGLYGAFAEEAIGKSWAKSGGIGLAKVMLASMSKQLPNL